MWSPGRISANTAGILSEQGAVIMEVRDIDIAGERLRLRGTLMGQFDSNMYIEVNDFYRVLALVLKPSPILFTLLSPFYWLKHYHRTHDRRSTVMYVLIMLKFSVISISVYLLMGLVIAMLVLGILSLAS